MDQLAYLKILADAAAGVETIHYEVREDSLYVFKLEDELESYGYEVVAEETKTLPDGILTVLTWEKTGEPREIPEDSDL